ncbi:MAG: site-2 protease family protein [Candidatus Bathyarchaeota archaeon]
MSKREGSLKGALQYVGKWGAGKNFRRFLWFIVFVAVIYLIVRNIGAFGNVLLVVLGFGAVVFVHEFGHFIVCKLSGIKVEAFSIGFPPTLVGVRRIEGGYRVRILPRFFPKEDDESGDGRLSFTIGSKAKAGPVRSKTALPEGTSNGAGETEYCIGLIPFGGFNKMLGQEDVGPVKASDDSRSFANKPVGVRMIVITAGVVFNAISAVVIFMIVFLVGIRLTAPVVGGVLPDSPASRAGLKAGDEIIEVAGKRDGLDFSNIALAAALSGVNEEVALRIRREDGSEEDFSLVAEQLAGMPMKVFGILPAQSLTIAKVRDAEELLERTGLRPGDQIKSINGREVHTHWDLEDEVADAFVSAVTLSVERTGPVSKGVELIELQIRLSLGPAVREVESESDLSHIYSMVPRLRIEDVVTKSKLQKGDIVLAIGDVANPTYKEIREVTEEYEGKELPVKVLRVDANGVEESLLVTVKPERSKDGKRVLIGIIPVLDAEHPVVAKTIAAEDGSVGLEIPRGAAITAVDGAGVSNFYDIIREIGRNPGERITIDWRIDEETAGDVALDVGIADDSITVKSTFAEFVPFEDLKRLYQASGPVDAIGMGYRKTVMFITQTYVTLRRLVGGLVSPKQLIGPVGILAVSYTIVAERPFVYYVYFLGLISACIAVFNFLPLPPLDGGLIVLLLVEKIKGSALSERAQGVIAYAGWVLIGGFFLYVTFNDIVRSVRGFF